MSEKEEKASDKILKEIADLKAEVQALKTLNKPPEKEEPKHEHWKAEDISETCPECIAEKQKIGKAYAKKEAEASKNLDYECVECGTHFSKKEKSCPSCGKTTVRSL